MTHVSAVFDTEAEADRALADLRASGVPDRALSIIAKHDGKTTETSGTGEVHDHGHGSIIRGLLGGSALGAGLGVAALAIPGVGRLMIDSIYGRDYPVIQGLTLALAVTVSLVFLLTDLLQAALDPRVAR